MRIVKIIPYYGSWPSSMHLYLESCAWNPVLEVVFVTDLIPFAGSPPNVSFFRLTFSELKKRIHRTLTVDVPDILPYKLCDFRPSFGLLFADVVGDANFWGYGDSDMILGDVASVLTPQRLADADVLSFKKGHLQGPLTFYRNCPHVNALFRTGGYHRKVFSSSAYLSFDEFGTGAFSLTLPRPDEVAELAPDNISVIAFQEALAGRLRVYCEQHGKEALSHGELLEYRDGHVRDARTGREYLFYHWVLEKRGIWFHYPAWFSERPRRFYMSTTGFYSAAEYQLYPILHLWRLLIGAMRWGTLKAANYIRRRLGRPVAVDTYPRVGWIKKLTAEHP